MIRAIVRRSPRTCLALPLAVAPARGQGLSAVAILDIQKSIKTEKKP